MSQEGTAKSQELLTVEQARGRLERLAFWTQDVNIHELQLQCIPKTKGTWIGLQREGITYPVLDRKGLKRIVGIPADAFREFLDDEQLTANMLRHCLRRKMGHIVRIAGCHYGVTSVQETNDLSILPQKVFDVVTKELGNQSVLVEPFEFGIRDLTMRFVGEYQQERKIEKGDVVRAGLVVKMNGQLLVGPYCLRLICTNGLMDRSESLQKVDPVRFESEMQNLIQTQHQYARQLTDSLMSLDEKKVEGDREQLLIQLGRQFKLPAHFISKAIERIPELTSEATMYDFVNLLTLIARDIKRPEPIQTRLGRLLSVISENNVPRCSLCEQKLPCA